MHNAQFDIPALRQLGNGWERISCQGDTMIMAYVLSRERQGLKWLSEHELGISMQGIDDLIQSGKFHMGEVPFDLVVSYAASDAAQTLELYRAFSRELDDEPDLKRVFELEMRVLPMLIRMTDVGARVDPEILQPLEDDIITELRQLIREIRRLAGDPQWQCESADVTDVTGSTACGLHAHLNPGSPEQLSRLLFEELDLEPIRSTDTPGQFSTAEAILEELRGDHPIIDPILSFRELKTLLTGFVRKLPKLLWADGRIHPQWVQTRVITGRLASRQPNLQNTPIRGSLGSKIRAAFIPDLGFLLVGADLKAIEVRILAHLTDDERLCQLIIEGRDPHRWAASLIFGISENDVPDRLRDVSKSSLFAIAYRAGPAKIGQLLRPFLSPSEATELVERRGRRPGADPYRSLAKLVIEGIYKAFPGLGLWQEREIELCRKRGYTQSILGRRRYLRYINHPSDKARAADERIACNFPIQSSASGDVMKLVMARLWEEYGGYDWYRPILQVHDELQDEVPEDRAESFRDAKREILESAMTLRVPLKADLKIGRSWADTH